MCECSGGLQACGKVSDGWQQGREQHDLLSQTESQGTERERVGKRQREGEKQRGGEREREKERKSGKETERGRERERAEELEEDNC